MVFDTIIIMVYKTIMDARKLFHYKETRGDVVVEMVIWQLPETSKQRAHGLKYRFFCGTLETCFVRYDNETGKGDHRHYDDEDSDYHFESIEKLVEDFSNDCARLAGWEW